MAVKKRTYNTSRGKKIDFMKTSNDIGKPIAIVCGVAGGKYIIKKLQGSEAVSGLLGTDIKTYLIPATTIFAGLIGTQFTKNELIKMGLYGVAGAGVESIIKKATGKSLLAGLAGIFGDNIEDIDYEEVGTLRALNPVTQALPAADIDIEREIQNSVSGAATDFSMSDDPMGSAASDFSMSDDPMGNTGYDTYEEIGKIKNLDPDSMDYDIFSGDMMES